MEPLMVSQMISNRIVMIQKVPLHQRKITMNRDFMVFYVLDTVDPLMQSTQLGIDLYTKALDLVRESIDLLNGL